MGPPVAAVTADPLRVEARLPAEATADLLRVVAGTADLLKVVVAASVNRPAAASAALPGSVLRAASLRPAAR